MPVISFYTEREGHKYTYPNKIFGLLILKYNILKLLILKYNLELLKDRERENALDEVAVINNIIHDSKSLQQNWNIFLTKAEKQYMNGFSPLNIWGSRYIRAGFRRLNMDRFFLRKQNLKEILNFIQCEAHVDVSKEIIKKYLKK